tara:strand:- start:361 stop:1185 length:825 start_codon:yes stop_codon:yes gene_type:complete
MIKNSIHIIKGSNNKDILIDVSFKETVKNKKIVIFSHGFKGFKDWGCFNLIAKIFADHNFVFIKFNFSHNGTTVSNPQEFVDLISFGNNNFSKELDDLSLLLDWIENSSDLSSEIYLLGHSRGGSVSILKAVEDKRVKKVISWASPSDLLNRISKEKINQWKQNKVIYVYNGRTKQNMPLYIQFHDDTINNRNRFNMQNAVKNLSIPQLIIHGDIDTTVESQEAKLMHEWNQSSELLIIKNGDHVFGATHPFEGNDLPKQLKEAVYKTIEFLNL